jgi:uncharacterized protein (DUF111 family)
MKALFIKCYSRMTPDMLVGGLIDMGVPMVYLQSEMKQLGVTAEPLETANPKSHISAHYFYLPPVLDSEDLTAEQLEKEWTKLVSQGKEEFLEPGLRVIHALTKGAAEAGIPTDQLNELGVRREDLLSLCYFLLGLSYLDIDGVFTAPFEVAAGKTEAGRLTEHVLCRSGSTVGAAVPAEQITPFAAAMMEGLSEDFTPMDGRFLVDSVSYGSISSERPTGDNTVGLYMGYFTDRKSSIFNRHMKTFGL